MIFPFLQYVTPLWYFNLTDNCTKSPIPYFLDFDKLPSEQQKLLNLDTGYNNRWVSKLDAAWQAWQKGFIFTNSDIALKSEQIHPTLSDNYRFLRKYFHSFWSWYMLGLRIFSFHPLRKELSSFWKAHSVKRINLYQTIYPHEENFRSYDSPLLAACPNISIIIPTLNRYPYLEDALHDLEQQTYQNFKVIIVDQSKPFQRKFYEKFDLDITVIHQQENALWKARNTAIRHTNSSFLLFFDDDSRVSPDWIKQHIKCIDYFKADISSGVSISIVGAPVPENYVFFRWADQLDTGNVLIKRQVFEKIGGFDQQFEHQRQGDGEFGLRAYLAGFKNISNPFARRLHLKVSSGGLRQMGHWDGFRPKNWLAPRPVPSVLYLARKYFGNRAAILLLLQSIPPSLISYRFKRNRFLLLLGIPLTLFLLPLVMWQVRKSWQQSTAMLKTGPHIEFLENNRPQLFPHKL